MRMRSGDLLPFDVSRFTPGMVDGDVIGVPKVLAMLEAARVAGCLTQHDSAMSMQVCKRLVGFLM